MSLSPLRASNRRLPNGVRIAARLRPAGRPGPTCRRGRAAGAQRRRACVGRAVAVDALDLDRGPHFAVELGVAVDVLHEVAVDAVHALFQVDVHQVHRRRRRAACRSLAFLVASAAPSRPCSCSVVTSATIVAPVVEQVALAVLLEDGAEDPAVAVEVGELRVLQSAGSGR